MTSVLGDPTCGVNPAALRTCPLDALTDELLGGDVCAGLRKKEVTRDAVIAAADSGLVVNPLVIEALGKLQDGDDPGEQRPPPLPLLSDYGRGATARAWREYGRVVGQLRRHFALRGYLKTRAFHRTLGVLSRHVGKTETALLRAAGRSWLARPGVPTARGAVQRALEKLPETVAGLALDTAPDGWRPVLVVYSTPDARSFLRRLVDVLRREHGHRGSVTAAVAVPEVFANLRLRRRAYLLTTTAPSDALVAAVAAAAAFGRERAEASGGAGAEKSSRWGFAARGRSTFRPTRPPIGPRRDRSSRPGGGGTALGRRGRRGSGLGGKGAAP
jgi:hypothetical protein